MKFRKILTLLAVSFIITGCTEKAPESSEDIEIPVSDVDATPSEESTVESSEMPESASHPSLDIAEDDVTMKWWENFNSTYITDNFEISVLLPGAKWTMRHLENGDFAISYGSEDVSCAIASIDGKRYYENELGYWMSFDGPDNYSLYMKTDWVNRSEITSFKNVTVDNNGLDEFTATLGVDLVNIGFDRATEKMKYVEFADGKYVTFSSVDNACIEGLDPASVTRTIEASEVDAAFAAVIKELEEVLQ